jgi:hypothetical protein
MAGKVVISTLNNDTGVLATQNGMTGIAKAWVTFAGSTGTISNFFNVSSITRSGTGAYTFNFTTAMPDTNYAYFTSVEYQRGINSQTKNTTSLVIGVFNTSTGSAIDYGLQASMAVLSL